MSEQRQNDFMLGRIDGKLDLVIKSQTEQGVRLDQMDDRLRKVEVTAAKAGAISGSLVSIGIAFIAEGIKAALHIKS